MREAYVLSVLVGSSRAWIFYTLYKPGSLPFKPPKSLFVCAHTNISLFWLSDRMLCLTGALLTLEAVALDQSIVPP